MSASFRVQAGIGGWYAPVDILDDQDDTFIGAASSGEWVGTDSNTNHVTWQPTGLQSLRIIVDVAGPWNSLVADKTILYRYVSGSSGNRDYELTVTTNKTLRLRIRTNTYDTFDSDLPIEAEDYERITLYVSVSFTSGINRTTVVFFQGAPDGTEDPSFVADPLSRDLGSDVEIAATPVGASGQVILAAPDIENAGDEFVLYALSVFQPTPTQILGFAPTEPTSGVTSFADTTDTDVTWTGPGGSNVVVANAEWVDITDYVRDFQTFEGRATSTNGVAEGIEATTASMTLDAPDRRFDPENSSGPYFGALLPRVPIRIQADPAGGSSFVTLWTGWVESGWPVEVEGPGSIRTALELVDLIAVAGQRLIGRDEFYDEAMYLYPDHYLTLDEGVSNDGVFHDSGFRSYNWTLTQGDKEVRTSDPLVRTESGKGLFLNNDSAAKIEASGSRDLSYPWTLAFWIKIQPITGSNTKAVFSIFNGSTEEVAIFINNSGFVAGSFNSGASFAASTGAVDDDERHFIIIRFTSSTAVSIEVDGNSVSSSDSGTFTTAGNGDDLRIASRAGTANTGLHEEIDEILIFPYDIGVSNDLYEAAISTAVAPRSGEKIKSLLSSAAVPANRYDVTANNNVFDAIMEAAEYGSSTLLPALDDAVSLERGLCRVDHRNGKMVIRERSWRDTPGSSVLTITDEDKTLTSSEARAEIILRSNSIRDIVNIVVVTWRGREFSFSDVESVRRYGGRRVEIESEANSYFDMEDSAQQILNDFKNPRSIVEAVVFDLGASPEYTERVLAVRPDDVVTVRRQPLADGSVSTTTHFVEGIGIKGEGKRLIVNMNLTVI